MEDNTQIPSFDDFELSGDDLSSLGDIINPTGDEVNENNQAEVNKEPAATEQNTNTDSEEPLVSESVATENPSTEGDDDAKSSPTIFSSTAKVLHEQGLLPSYDANDTKLESADDFASFINKELDTQLKAKMVEKVGEKGYEFIEKGVSLEEAVKFKQNMDSLDNIGEDQLSEDLELSKKIILQDAVNQGMSEARATKYLSRLTDLGDEAIVNEAKESLEGVKEYVQQEAQRVADANAATIDNNNKALAKEQDDFKKSIYDTKTIGDNITFDRNFQDKVMKSINTVVGNDDQGNPENQLLNDRRTNRVEFDTKLYYIYELTKGFKDFSAFTSSGRSSAVQDLERAMQNVQHTNVGAGSANFSSDPDSYDSILGDDINI